jgi:hypothetical protein
MSLALPEPTHLRQVAAVGHVAPLAAVVAGRVDEEPPTRRAATLLELIDVVRPEKRRRREGDRPQHAIQVYRVLDPPRFESPFPRDYTLMPSSLANLPIEGPKVGAPWRPILDQSLANAIDRFAKRTGPLQEPFGGRGRPPRLVAQGLRLGRLQERGKSTPAQEALVIGDVVSGDVIGEVGPAPLPLRGGAPPPDRVHEVEAGPHADEAPVRVGWGRFLHAPKPPKAIIAGYHMLGVAV